MSSQPVETCRNEVSVPDPPTVPHYTSLHHSFEFLLSRAYDILNSRPQLLHQQDPIHGAPIKSQSMDVDRMTCSVDDIPSPLNQTRSTTLSDSRRSNVRRSIQASESIDNQPVMDPSINQSSALYRLASSYRGSTVSVMELMWDADQQSIGEGHEIEQPSGPREITSKRSLQILTPRIKEDSSRNNDDASFPEDLFKSIETPMRRISRDYPIPKWMFKNKVFVDGYKCLYRYSRTFIGSYGVVNYEIEGNPNDQLVRYLVIYEIP